jgi:RNA polymerase-binding transcription factor DksA
MVGRHKEETRMIPHSTRRSQLEQRYADLEARIASIDGELDQEHSSDWEEQAIEREGDEVLETMGISAQQEMRQIEAALERLDAGDYGLCVVCGERISDRRLDVLPYTPYCRNCAP